jgi:hypothetical protein
MMENVNGHLLLTQIPWTKIIQNVLIQSAKVVEQGWLPNKNTKMLIVSGLQMLCLPK